MNVMTRSLGECSSAPQAKRMPNGSTNRMLSATNATQSGATQLARRERCSANSPNGSARITARVPTVEKKLYSLTQVELSEKTGDASTSQAAGNAMTTDSA